MSTSTKLKDVIATIESRVSHYESERKGGGQKRERESNDDN